MDWTQTLAIIGSTTLSMIGTTYTFYRITDKRIDRMEEHHREDMKDMDAKWERLFKRLLIQDQERGK